MVNEKEIYDVIIVGAGPAGLTAGMYAARYGLKTLILGFSSGSLTAEAHKICNYPSEIEIVGPELVEKIKNHAVKDGAELKEKIVNKISGNADQFEIYTQDGEIFNARTVILALGTKHRKLNLSNEDKFLGKGVSYCFTCDGAFFKGKIVAIAGGSDAAVTAALYFSEICPQAYLIYRKDKLRAEASWVKNLSTKTNVKIIYNTNVVNLSGEGKLEKIELDNPFDGNKFLTVDGLFIEIGEVPDKALTELLGIDLDEYGFIKIDQSGKTNVEGIWAAGDITTGSDGFRQIITGCAEGAIAAKSVFGYLSEKSKS